MTRRSTSVPRRPIAALMFALATTASLAAGAQPKKPPKRPSAAAQPKAATGGEADAAPAGADDAAAGVAEQKTADGGTRVFRFDEVEVEGRLKSPQIVYFLRRVRAELAMTDLGHRSFMGELHETKSEPVF